MQEVQEINFDVIAVGDLLPDYDSNRLENLMRGADLTVGSKSDSLVTSPNTHEA
jgi:hypothetical protein